MPATLDTRLLLADIVLSNDSASLADGRQIAPLDNSGNLLGVACSGFHPTADLKVHRFRSAHTSIGTLHLSVVLDQACLMRFALAASLLRNIPALDAPERKGPLCIAQSDAALISDSCPESEMQHKLPKQPLSAQPSQQPQSAQAQTGLADASTIRRTSSGSPFPSPKMQKRALFLANLKLDHPDPSLSGSRTPHTGSCTPMASSSASIASTPRFHSPLAHKRSVTLLPRSLAIPDSADLDSSNLQTSLVTPPMPQSSTVPAFRSSLREHMMRSSSSSSEEGDDLSVLPPRPPSITPLRTSSHASNRDSKSRNAAAACAGGVMTASHTDAVDDYNLSDIGSRHSLRRVSTSITSSITHDKHSAAVTPVASRRVSMPAMSSKLSGDSVFFSPLSPFARGALSPTPSPQAELNNPLVGSYEESILSGRMSTFSSKPISFLAEIGVIAFGKCKSSLKCPPHLIVAFPAYFFELRDDDLPVTPYVGSIEVDWRAAITEHHVESLQNEPAAADDAPALAPAPSATNKEHDTDANSEAWEEGGNGEDVASESADQCEQNSHPKRKSSSRSKKSTTDHNGYRLPPRGQIQIVIKNPSRTAIKVFLIQYDLRDMPANTKTFLRQKSYALSTVPSPTKGAGSPSHSHRRTESSPTASSPRRQQVGVDDYLATSPHLPSLSSNISSDSAGDDTAATILPIPVSAPQTRRPSQSPSGSTAQRIQLACDRLRYAIHLQFICTAKRHLYLSKSIRVVFSHRAPDADEKLRTVCEGPTNPKYLPLEACTPALQPSAVVLAPDASGTSSASGTVFSRQYPSEPQSSILDQPANQQIGQQTNEAASESATARDALLEIAATKAFQRTRTVSGFTIRSTSPEPPSSHVHSACTSPLPSRPTATTLATAVDPASVLSVTSIPRMTLCSHMPHHYHDRTKLSLEGRASDVVCCGTDASGACSDSNGEPIECVGACRDHSATSMVSMAPLAPLIATAAPLAPISINLGGSSDGNSNGDDAGNSDCEYSGCGAMTRRGCVTPNASMLASSFCSNGEETPVSQTPHGSHLASASTPAAAAVPVAAMAVASVSSR